MAVLGGRDHLCGLAEDEVRSLEAQWSRFIPDSDVSRLNAAGGDFVDVAGTTRALIETATRFRADTRGWFDPFMADDLVALGYDRSMDEVRRQRPIGMPFAPPDEGDPIGEPLRRPAPTIVDEIGRIALRDGAAFDPGGIGKGLAADLVAAAVIEQGGDGVLVNLGGDLAVLGETPAGGWRIAIRNPFDEDADPIGEIGVAAGGLATSSPLRRRWQSADGRAAHHILDPRTRRPAAIALASITVVAQTAVAAEALATTVMLAGPHRGQEFLARYDATAYAVDIDGALHVVAP